MVGNKHCSYGLCNSDARYSHKDHMKGVFFVPFPKPHRNFVRCQLWVRACGRAEFTIANIKRNSYICSKHFVGLKGPTSEHPDPLPFVATDADIRESETRGKVGRNHRKRINLAPSSSESENSQHSNKVENKSNSSQYYTIVTLPNSAVSGSQLTTNTTSCTTSPNSAVVSPKLLLISQSNSKVQNKQMPLVDSVAGNEQSIPNEHEKEYSTETPAVPSSGGQIVAVKNFVIHGQKYTAVHINPDGQEEPTVQPSTKVRSRRKQLQNQGDGVFISKNNVNIAVPRSWCVQEDSNVFTFRRISSSDSVLLSVVFNEETSDIVLKVLGMQITSHPILECLPNPVKLNNISFVLKQFERWKVCKGNPDEKFQAVFHQRPKSSAFYSWIDDSVHSKTCELLSLKERCTPCKNYRGYLRCVLNREKKKEGKVSLSSVPGQTRQIGPEDSGEDEKEEEEENQMLE